MKIAKSELEREREIDLKLMLVIQDRQVTGQAGFKTDQTEYKVLFWISMNVTRVRE